MNIALWVLQVLLALAFFGAGWMKAFSPADALAEMGVPILLLRIAGFSELLGAVGLLLPAATRIQPRLTGVAAACLAFVMVLAVGTHVLGGDFAGIVPALVLGSLSAFVAWGRLVAHPIKPR